MDEADPPGRVEIGHTADAHSGGWERPRGNAIGNDESSSGVFPAGLSERSIPSSTEQAGLSTAPSPLPFPRRRVLAAGAAIVALGLLVGWVIGRADREPVASDGERQRAVTTQVATTISLVEGSLPVEVGAIAISSSTLAGTVPTTMGASGSTALTRQSLMVEGIPFSFVSLPGWEPYVGDPPFDAIFHISKSTIKSQAAEALIFWAGFPEGTDANACSNLMPCGVGWRVEPPRCGSVLSLR